MDGKMRLLLLLLNPLITRWIQHSESANCIVNISYNDPDNSGIKMAKLSFMGHNITSCNLTVNARETIMDQCLIDIEFVNNSCLLNQSSISPTTTDADVCMNETVESTKFITITSTHTQEVYSQTTVSICPMPTPSSSEDTSLVTSTVSTVYITMSSDSTNIPATTSATGLELSNAAQISVLATSGVLMCLPISAALVIVTYCWIRTRRTLKKREGTGTNIVCSARDSINPPDISLDNNPAYETRTPLQRNLAYEDTTLQSQSADEPQSSSTQDPTYEIIPPAASANTITAQTQRSGEDGDEYNRLNREPPNTGFQ